MTWNEVFCNTFKALSEELGLPPAGKSLVELCRADDADFCQEVVAKGWLFGMQLRSATLGTDPSVQPEVADICVSPQCCTVAIVESERSAVVLSELFPECIWMAYSYPSNFTVDKLAPLQGCVVLSILIRILLVVLMSRSSNWLIRLEGYMISICRW